MQCDGSLSTFRRDISKFQNTNRLHVEIIYSELKKYTYRLQFVYFSVVLHSVNV
jgi:hypothetical protein